MEQASFLNLQKIFCYQTIYAQFKYFQLLQYGKWSIIPEIELYSSCELIELPQSISNVVYCD